MAFQEFADKRVLESDSVNMLSTSESSRSPVVYIYIVSSDYTDDHGFAISLLPTYASRRGIMISMISHPITWDIFSETADRTEKRRRMRGDSSWVSILENL